MRRPWRFHLPEGTVKLTSTAGISGTLVVLCAGSVSGQLAAAIDLGSGVEQAGSGPWIRRSQVVPTLWFADPFGYLRAQSISAERIGRSSMGGPSLEAMLASPAIGPFAAAWTSQFTSDRAGPTATHTTSALVDAELSVRRGAGGVWLGAGRRRDDVALESSRSNDFSAGGWRGLGPLILTM